MRLSVWRNTIAVALLYAIAILVADRLLLERFAIGGPMALALAFGLAQLAAIVIMVAGLFVRKQRSVLRLARSRRLAPQIQETLAMHAIGADERARVEQLMQQSPADVREALFAMIASMRGEPRERVAALAWELGFVDRTGQEAIDWIRNLIRFGHSTQFEPSVSWIARQNLLIRAIATEELESYAAQIPESQIAHALQSTDVQVVITTLDMLRAWRRALQVGNFVPLLMHSDARVRSRALLAVPYAAANASAESLAPAIVASLDHESAEVRAAAAAAAGRMGVRQAVSALAMRLSDPDRQVALTAAFALASLGEGGNALLDRAVLSPSRTAASVAFEALEKSALGLAELA